MQIALSRRIGSQEHVSALEIKIKVQHLPYLSNWGEVSAILLEMKQETGDRTATGHQAANTELKHENMSTVTSLSMFHG
jgi:hypothetical protein